MNINMVMQGTWTQEDSKKYNGERIVCLAPYKSLSFGVHEPKFRCSKSSLVPSHEEGIETILSNPALHSTVTHTHTSIWDKWTTVNFYWGTFLKKPQSQFILEARATTETLNEVFKHMFWTERGRADCVGYNHKQSSLKRALILKGLQRNNQFMCTITKCKQKESHIKCFFFPALFGPQQPISILISSSR